MTDTCIYYRQCIQMCACMDPGGGGGGEGCRQSGPLENHKFYRFL